MEKFMAKCRIVLLAKSTSRIIEPLRSRCLPIKCRAATSTELTTIGLNVIHKEFYNNFEQHEKIIPTLLSQANRDIRKFLLMLEVYKVQLDAAGGTKTDIQVKQLLPDWELFVEKLI